MAATYIDMIRIKNTVVDANVYIQCNGANFKPSYKKNVANNPLNGQFSGTNYLIAKSDRVGVENPTFAITGFINVNDFSVISDLWSTTPSTINSVAEDGTLMLNNLTLGYLLAIWRNMTGQNYLSIYFGDPANQTTWKTYDLSSDDIPIEIDTIDINPRQDSEGNHFIDYTILCHEVEVEDP
jgi:hypothetical protein